MRTESARERLANLAKSLSPKKSKSGGSEETAAGPSNPSDAPEQQTGSSAPADFTLGIVQTPPVDQGDITVQSIVLDLIVASPYQPRQRDFTKKDLEELVRSIAANGQTQPIIVTPGTGEHQGKYIVHSGHRRCAALRIIGAATVRTIVRELDERSARKLALADNLGREDLTAWEQAEALRQYCEAYQVEVAQAADELGLNRRYAFRLHAITKASPELLEIIRANCLSARVADPLVRIEARDSRKGLRLAKRFVAGELTTKAVEDEIAHLAGGARAARVTAAKDVELRADSRRVRLTVSVARGQLQDDQRERISGKLAEFLGYLGIEQVVAVHVVDGEAEIEPEGDES